MKTVCEYDQCVGCMACVVSCHKDAILLVDGWNSYNAVVNTDKCINCGLCTQVCQQKSLLEKKEPMIWKQGWAKDKAIRNVATSGGFATAIMQSFVLAGGSVCSCLFNDGKFVFEITKDPDRISKFTGSKYVKSNSIGAYYKVEKALKNGEKVLFLGLPCQVAGIKLFIKKQYQDNLYTVDLICHGTPSLKTLNVFLNSKGIYLDKIRDIKFRSNHVLKSDKEYVSVLEEGVEDSYTYSFLKRVTFTENCYSCKYAGVGRISDLTLGDSWGSDMQSEMTDGLSLALCQTEKGKELLYNSNLVLFDVDKEGAIANNAQLRKAANKSEKREKFLSSLEKGLSYEQAMLRCYPVVLIRQKIKELLIKIRIIKRKDQPYTIRYKR